MSSKKEKWKCFGAILLMIAMVFTVTPSIGYAEENTLQEHDDAQVQNSQHRIRIESEMGIAYAVKINPDETGGDVSVNEAFPGDKIRLSFSDYKMPDGKDLAKWVDDIGNITDMENETSYEECTFTMPDEDVKIHIEFAENCPTVNVENGGLMVTMGNDFKVLNHSSMLPGRKVYLYYDHDLTPKGKVFSEWYVKDVANGNVILSDPKSMEKCSFIMPDHDVKIGVKYKEGYSISVENGYAQYYLPNGQYIWNTSTATPGTEMHLRINPYTRPEGMAFSKWVVKKGNVTMDNPYCSYDCPFIMPSEDVEIAAEFVPGHKFAVEGGATCKTIPGGFDWYIDMATPGDTVWAICGEDDIPLGKEFSRWVVKTGNIELEHPEDKQCSFIMPDEDVYVCAEYKTKGTETEDAWVQDGEKWRYQHADGSFTTNDFEVIDGKTYYFDQDGYRMNGWQYINGDSYYFYEDGHMAVNETTPDGYYVNGSGIWTVDQWVNDENGWWYSYKEGGYPHDTFEEIDGKTYY